MKQLNKNNFIVWVGEFNPGPFSVVANNDSATMNKGDAKLELYPLNNDFATFGINAASLEITLQDNAQKPAVWDAIAQKLTYYLPASAEYGQTRALKYRFKDNAGNLSNEATVSIGVNYAATAWRGLTSSFQCLKDGAGENTGFGYYATLEKYYVSDNKAVVPAETKPNADTDPNYIAPTASFQCPLPVDTLQFGFFSQVPNTKDYIQYIALYNGGVAVKSISVTVYANTPNQPVIINVPPGTYEEMRIGLFIYSGTPRTLQFRPGSGGSGGATVSVGAPPSVGMQSQAIFYNVKFGTTYAGDIIIS